MKKFVVECYCAGIAESKEFESKKDALVWAKSQANSPLFEGGDITLVSIEKLY